MNEQKLANFCSFIPTFLLIRHRAKGESSLLTKPLFCNYTGYR